MKDIVKIEKSWRKVLSDEFEKPYFQDLSSFIKEEYKTTEIFPKIQNIFKALDMCPLDKTRVIILGQDPYHGVGQANGLCFAVESDMTLPPSLKNIFKEIKEDLGIDVMEDGDLTRWARQGVLLLNATLTVRTGLAGSHQKKGWEEFTDTIIKKLSEEKENLVFILWGNYAKNKGVVIDRKKHLVLESAHPSPFSAYNGFFGNKHFSQTNKYLKDKGFPEINWR